MRKSHVFVGSSHPELGKLICDRLGVEPGPCTLRKFANGETSIEIGVSVRDEDVYIVQSGSDSINDHIMELLIFISGCRSGSANKITAVIPSFPYSKQSKMKKHRGAITARMLANLLTMAGADHVITVDLHASQMQGFFTKPVDNLYAGPTLARWIRQNIPDYAENAVMVSKNPGGTKRVTALADALKVNFAMIHTDRRRKKSSKKLGSAAKMEAADKPSSSSSAAPEEEEQQEEKRLSAASSATATPSNEGVHVGRVVQGHVVDADFPEPETLDLSAEAQVHATVGGVARGEALGGTVNVDISDDDEEDPQLAKLEKLITLVGDVRDKTAVLLDDMVDRAGSFIAAAEHCVYNCGARAVIVIATHGIFSGNALDELEKSPCVDKVVVTNTYPIAADKLAKCRKLTVIDISPILAECIRRNHHGESISALFEQLAIL
jgi:ribose-phosphate pyrophosphokinase